MIYQTKVLALVGSLVWTTATITTKKIFTPAVDSNELSSKVEFPPSSFASLNNRGVPTFIVGEGDYNQVDIIATFEDQPKKLRKLSNPDPTTAGFGKAVGVDDEGDVFVSRVHPTLGLGTVFVYDGEYSTWSVQQELSPPAQFKEASYFGYNLDVDPSDFETLAVGCPNCNSSGYHMGTIYLYESSKSKSWELTQEFAPYSAYNLGWTFVQLYDNLLVSSYTTIADIDLGTTQALVAKKGKDSKFVAVQSLAVPLNNINAADVFEDTIVLASKTQGFGSANGAGLVYIYSAFDAPGKPRPTQWSVQQVLASPSPADSNYFGSAISLDENRLIVTESGTESYYVYEKSSTSGAWSQQQSIDGAGLATGFVSLVGDTFSASSAFSGTGLTFYTTSDSWDCLQISLEDQFGDGWDVATLVVETPSGERDHFSSRCDLINPLRIRYCPQKSSDSGLYKISVADGPKSKFSWEILWRVFEERTGEWFVGGVDSSIDFVWDSSNLEFMSKKTKVLSNVTCVACPGKPTPKPTPPPKPSPHLRKLADHTSHPTHTPAPTFDVDELAADWEVLTLKTNSEQWFDDNHHSAYYYVTDPKGRKVITSGTLCPNDLTEKQCWVDIPDGEYIVRVGGALSTSKNDFTWKFCRSANYIKPQTQLLVKIEDGDCQLVSYHDYFAYCDSIEGFDPSEIVLIEIVLLNVGIDSFSPSDQIVFKEALSSMFTGVSSSDINILSVTPSYSGGGSVIVSVDVTFSHQKSGLSFTDFDGIDKLQEIVKTTLQNEGAVNLWQRLVSGSHSSNLHATTSVEMLSYKMHGSRDIVTTASPELVVTVTDELTTPTTVADESHLYTYVGFGVYGLCLVGLLGAVAFFVFPRSAAPAGSIPLPKSDVEVPSVRKARTSAPVLSASDFQKMVQDEDNVLKMMLSNGPKL